MYSDCDRLVSHPVRVAIESTLSKTPSGPAPTVPVLERSPSYRELSYSKVTEKQQGREHHVSVNRELTVLS